jgi:hypothetical protein
MTSPGKLQNNRQGVLITMKRLRSKDARRAGGMAQAVEYLPSKHTALSSSPSIKKKKRIYLKELIK